MIVETRMVSQARKAALLRGGLQGDKGLSRRVNLGEDFEIRREAVESVSVLFRLYRRNLDSGELEEVPSGWSITGTRFEVHWPEDPERAALVRSHFGARRFVYNWALAQVKAGMTAKQEDPHHQSLP